MKNMTTHYVLFFIFISIIFSNIIFSFIYIKFAPPTFTVSSVPEFIAALGSNRIIMLEAGDYVLDDAYGTEHTGIVWNNERYNYQPLLKIADIRHLTITSKCDDEPARLLSRSWEHEVLGFENSSNITLANLVIGHVEEASGNRGILSLNGVTNMRVMNCEFINSGMDALSLTQVDGFEFKGSSIRDSYNSIVEAIDSRDIRFINSTFNHFDTGSVLVYHHLINLFNTKNVVFEHCNITENTVFVQYQNAALFNVSDHSTPVIIRHSRIEGNRANYLALAEGSVIMDDATVIDSGQFLVGLYQYHNADPVTIPQDRVATSMNEVIAMIADNATIYLAPGDYIVDDAAFRKNPHVSWQDTADGFAQMRIHDVSNLKIIGQQAGQPARILSKSRYSYVLTFTHTNDLELVNLTIGHLVNDAGCESGVIDIRHSQQVRMENTDLFGSGEEGLHLEQVRGFHSINGIIRECTAGLMSILESEDIVFEKAQFIDTYDVYQDLESYTERDGIRFDNSYIHKKEGG